METRFFGSDPELFICNRHSTKETEYGNLVNVIPPAALIADNGIEFTLSNNGKRILSETSNCKIIEDGAAIEFNFKYPIDDSHRLYSDYVAAKSHFNQFLRHIDANLYLSNSVLGFFDNNKYWKNRDKNFIDAVRFGCDPDVFPKYYMLMKFEEEYCKIIDASNHDYRYAGGHLHIQNMSEDSDVYINDLEFASICLDFFVGTTNLCLNRAINTITEEKARLKFYGRPGRVRLQKYSDKVNGIEYRPPSNFWINDIYNVETMLSAANIAANIVEKYRSRDFYDNFKERIPEMWEALTTYNRELALNLLADSLTWSLDNNLSTLSEVENVYGKF